MHDREPSPLFLVIVIFCCLPIFKLCKFQFSGTLIFSFINIDNIVLKSNRKCLNSLRPKQTKWRILNSSIRQQRIQVWYCRVSSLLQDHKVNNQVSKARVVVQNGRIPSPSTWTGYYTCCSGYGKGKSSVRIVLLHV